MLFHQTWYRPGLGAQRLETLSSAFRAIYPWPYVGTASQSFDIEQLQLRNSVGMFGYALQMMPNCDVVGGEGQRQLPQCTSSFEVAIKGKFRADARQEEFVEEAFNPLLQVVLRILITRNVYAGLKYCASKGRQKRNFMASSRTYGPGDIDSSWNLKSRWY